MIREDSSRSSSTIALPLSGCTNVPRARSRFQPAIAQLRMLGSSAASRASSARSSRPSKLSVMCRTRNRPASARLESVSQGVSFVSRTSRVGSWPVQYEVFLRLHERVSSPESDSSRSVTTDRSLLADSRASPTIASGLPISGSRPKDSARLASVGPTVFSTPIKRRSTRAMVPLPERGGPTSSRILCWLVSGVRQ